MIVPYRKNRIKKDVVVKTKTALKKSERRAWLLDLKIKSGCIKCGEKHPACLSFHHRDPTLKSFELSRGIDKRSMDKVLEEIAKCDILCMNCHMKVHHDEKSGIKNFKIIS